MWGRFFESLGNEDTESVLSGSNIPTESHHSRHVSRSVSHMVQSSHSDVHPNDSASVVDEEREDGHVRDRHLHSIQPARTCQYWHRESYLRRGNLPRGRDRWRSRFRQQSLRTIDIAVI